MPNAAFYREEARRCREKAAIRPAITAAKRLRGLAEEYDMLAAELEAANPPPPKFD